MTWEALPFAGVIAAIAIPVLVILYFLKLRRAPRMVACTLLWKKSIEDLRANAPFQRLRRNLLLLLQLIILILVIVAIARPNVLGNRPTAERIVIMIDRSRSMSAVDQEGGLSRLEQAKRDAIRLVEALPSPRLFSAASGDKQASVMVIAFAERAQLYTNFTTDRRQIIDAIKTVTPTDGRTNIGEALKLSRAFGRSVEAETRGQQIEDPATIELFTDGNIADIADQVVEGGQVNYHAIGEPETQDNLAVVAMDAMRLYDRPTELSVFATLANFAGEERAADVQLSLSGTPVQLITINLPAAQKDDEAGDVLPGTRGITFSIPSLLTGGTVEIRQLREDVLASDDAGILVIPPPKRAAVAAVTSDLFLRDALSGMPIDVTFLEGRELDAQIKDGRASAYDVIVLDGYVPENELRSGRFLTFGSPPKIAGLEDSGAGQGTFAITWDKTHPAMRNLELDNLFIGSYRQLKTADEMQLILEGATGPLAVSVSRGQLQAIVVAFRPVDSWWPLDVSYIVFLADSIRYLTDRGQSATQQSIVPGEAITMRLAETARDVRLLIPGEGGLQTWRAEDPTALTYGPVECTGLYHVLYRLDGEKHERFIAANLFDPAESRVQPEFDLRMARSSVSAVSVGSAQVQRPLWPWALGLGLAVLFFEWWIYNRRVYL
ncbi:MAG: VWA domain-containing protein [Phycisphaerales bacterium]|nr:VWA domain-containing protein [Phycisphaerales bacterium]